MSTAKRLGCKRKKYVGCFQGFFSRFSSKIIDVRNSAIEILPKPPYNPKSSHILYRYGNMGVQIPREGYKIRKVFD